jgi:hypothetical protein
MSAEHLNFERIFYLANTDFGDATSGRIGIFPFPDQQREVEFVDAPMARFYPAVVV